MKLYELNEEIALAEGEIETWAMEHEGDITGCPFDKILDELNIEKEQKLLGVASWYKNLISDSKAIADEVKALTARKKAIEAKAERLKLYIDSGLEKGKKISDSKSALSWRKSVSVLVVCEPEALPAQYRTEKVVITADKAHLKEALKSGEKINCVSLSENLNLQIK